jgi:choline dehydrogenase
VIDTAKAARLCVQQAAGFGELVASGLPVPVPAVALIAVPTTAGTGSEVSGGAVITDVASGRKAGIASPNLRAQYAIVDPLLTHSVPRALTAYTGVDALAQAIAGMIARVRTPIGDAIAMEAIRLIGHSLVRAWRNGDDAAARSAMACGSLMAGLAMNISDCTAEHSLAQAIASVRHAPHGLTIGVVLPHTLERERPHVAGQLERVADALRLDPAGPPGAAAIDWIRDLLADLEFPVLASLGVGEEDLDQLTEFAMRDPFLGQSTVPWTAEEVRAVLRAAVREPPRRRSEAR